MEAKSAYQPVISRTFNDIHFKLLLPVIKEFSDRVDASFKFIYKDNQEEINTVLEKCIITDRFGKEHSSHMDYALLSNGKTKEVTISVPVESRKIYVADASVEFVFLCSNNKKISVFYHTDSSRKSMLKKVEVCQMTSVEHSRMIDIVNLILKTVDDEQKSEKTTDTDNRENEETQTFESYTAYTSSDISEYSDALHKEIFYLKQGKGKKYKIVNGNRLNVSDKGIFTYSFEMETELHLPDDAPVVVETFDGLRAVGSVLACEDFEMILLLDRDLNDKVNAAHLMVEPWKLLEALDKRMTSLNPNVHKLAIRIMRDGPGLATNDDIRNVPMGQPAVSKKLESDDIVTVWGPPGTGKTYTMAKIVNNYIAQNKSVLIVSHSNVSVDGVIKQVVKMLDSSLQSYLENGKILRFGYVRDEELSQNPYATSFNYTLSKCETFATRLINVAITRGKGKVIVVANARFWENIFKGRNHVFYRLLQHIKNKNHQVVEYQDKTLQPYVESINPGKVVDIFVDEQDAIAKFEQDMLKAKWKVVISLPSGELRETENQIFKLIDDADSRGVDILMKSNDYASLPQHWKNYCRGTENATFPLIIIDDEVAWYGLPTANWKFDVDKTTSLKTVVYMMVRFKGKNTVEMLKALTDIETVAIGVNTKKLLKKDNNMVTHPMASSSGVVVPDDGKSAYGLAGFVEEKEFCPACKSHMVLTKNARGTAYLKCSNKACKETKYLTVDLMNWYISSHNVGCPKHDGGELKGRLGKYGPYVICTCGHTLKPHDI